MNSEIILYCPNCGHKLKFSPKFKGKLAGGSGGAISGALIGAKVGIAAGPLGAIAGTIPGAILGAIFGKDFGKKFDKPKCSSCNNSFEIPNNLKESFLSSILKSEVNHPKTDINSNKNDTKSTSTSRFANVIANATKLSESHPFIVDRFDYLTDEEMNKMLEKHDKNGDDGTKMT